MLISYYLLLFQNLDSSFLQSNQNANMNLAFIVVLHHRTSILYTLSATLIKISFKSVLIKRLLRKDQKTDKLFSCSIYLRESKGAVTFSCSFCRRMSSSITPSLLTFQNDTIDNP